jgi:hypothetical protein
MSSSCAAGSRSLRTRCSSAPTMRLARRRDARRDRCRCRRSYSTSCRCSATARRPVIWCSLGAIAATSSGRSRRPDGFQAAVKKAKVQKITPHNLRHTCASLAVSAGVNVLALQRMLGHKSAKVTLDTYADLFDDDLDAVAVSLHARYSAAHNCDSPKLLASWGQNAATAQSQGVASKRESGCLTAEMPPPHQCGRRDSNPHALSSTGT